MYKPNFCAECGSRVERERWLLWTSGRFCAACEGRFHRKRFFVPFLLSAILLSVGFVAGRVVRPAAPPLIITRGDAAAVTPRKDDNTAGQPDATNSQASGAKTSETSEPRYGADGTATERPTEMTEIISMCGARTKKGTPCSRRVRGTGRCWQHRGMPAMLPPSKLIVPN